MLSIFYSSCFVEDLQYRRQGNFVINLRVKNTFEPNHPGTLITREFVSDCKRVEFISGSDKLLIIDVYDPPMVGEVGTDLKIM